MDDVPEVRRRMMAAVRGKHTKPELVVRRAAHGAGYRFRLHRKDLPGRPDLTFPARRKVIEVRGCFWHRHAGCAHATIPRTRREWWTAKLNANVGRDTRNESLLADRGWELLVIWGCEVGDAATLDRRLRSFLGPPGGSGGTDADHVVEGS